MCQVHKVFTDDGAPPNPSPLAGSSLAGKQPEPQADSASSTSEDHCLEELESLVAALRIRLNSQQKHNEKIELQQEGISEQLKSISAALASAPPPISEAPTPEGSTNPRAQPLLPSTHPIMVSAMVAQPLIKAATPADFNGECDRGKAFMATCRTHICLNPGAFADDDTKIIWAMLYMKSGRASQWAQRELATEAS